MTERPKALDHLPRRTMFVGQPYVTPSDGNVGPHGLTAGDKITIPLEIEDIPSGAVYRIEVEPATSFTIGRPRLEDKDKTAEALKPWKAAGMSRATWYNRRKERRATAHPPATEPQA